MLQTDAITEKKHVKSIAECAPFIYDRMPTRPFFLSAFQLSIDFYDWPAIVHQFSTRGLLEKKLAYKHNLWLAITHPSTILHTVV